MTIKDIVKEEQYVTPDIKILQVTKQLLKDLRNLVFDETKYKYIELVYSYYEDEEDTTMCTWQDVEGFGYGWLWIDTPEEKWHKKIAGFCSRYLKKISFLDKNLVKWEKDGFVCYRLLRADGKEDLQILLGNDLDSNYWYI